MFASESAVVRISIEFDYELMSSREVDLADGLLHLGEEQFNAPCNNREARIVELEQELGIMAPDNTEGKADIERVIQEMKAGIANDKKQGYHRDYGELKRRISSGSTAADVYEMLPFFYAEAYDLSQRIRARRNGKDGPGANGLINTTTPWLQFVKALLEFIPKLPLSKPLLSHLHR